MGVYVVRIEVYGSSVFGICFLKVALRLKDNAKILMGSHVARIET